ncbi:MAG TPA: deoxyribodipyrimidine photo-lyase, partial [Solirubrobacterales bacterium]|nr:deoxyribodipyrimidine photo-lyase [Solirubrobacterales bacterium]
MPTKTAIVLFTRDLRVTDNPALWAASRAERTVPLFVLDDAILGSRFAAPNRVAYMREALIDLDGRLKAMDGRLFLRRGQVVEEAMRVGEEAGATELHIAADWSAYARRREDAMREACEAAGIDFTAHPGVTILEPGAVTPTGGDHFKVFSPYHRAWNEAPWREGLGAPRKLSVPPDLAAGELPALAELTDGTPSPDREPGGET